MLEVEDHHLSTSDASDTMKFSGHLWHTVSHRSRHSCCACKSGVRYKGIFLCAACLLLVAETEWPSHCKCELVWNWTKK